MSDELIERLVTLSDAILLVIYLLCGVGYWFVTSGGVLRVLIGLTVDALVLRSLLLFINGTGRREQIRRLKARFQ